MENKNDVSKFMKWIKNHADTGIIVAAVLFALNYNINKFGKIDDKLSVMEKDITMIKTVLILNHMIPPELVKSEEKK